MGIAPDMHLVSGTDLFELVGAKIAHSQARAF
jgi:hypothetical protein